MRILQKLTSRNIARLEAISKIKNLPLILASLAVLLTLPSLWMGFVFDDIFHRHAYLGYPGVEESSYSPPAVFAPVRGDAEETLYYRDLGQLPWWTDPELRLAFWRPLSILTHRFDYWAWPEFPAFMHAQSLIWFAALIFAVAAFYRRMFGATFVAALAALFYMVDDARGVPVSWLANRNAVIAAFFGVLALFAHIRWRSEKWRPGAWLSPFFFGLGLAAAEFALGALGYFAAYAVVLEEGNLRRRIATLVPVALVFLAWGVFYRMMGYGASNSAVYVDPAREPFLYLTGLLSRLPLFLLGQWALPPPEMVLLSEPAAVRNLWIVALVLIAILAFILTPLLRTNRQARFWGLGMMLSLAPICATFVHTRLLFFVGLGAFALLAQLVEASRHQSPLGSFSGPRRVMRRVFVTIMIAIHLGLAPLLLPIMSISSRLAGETIYRAIDSVPDDPLIAQQDLIIVNAPDFFFLSTIGPQRAISELPLPRRFRNLVMGPVRARLERREDQILRISYDPGMPTGLFNEIFRSPRRPFKAGDLITMPGLTVEVIEIDNNGRVIEADFRFALSLEDPSLRWMAWNDGIFEDFEPPAIGQSVTLPKALPPYIPSPEGN